MIVEKKNILRPILESSQGLHLTAYLENRGDLAYLKSQLQETIDEAGKWLLNIQTEEEQKRFLEPLFALLDDARIFKDIKGNVGLFRNENSFRILNIPIEVEQSCQVATSFHVKPLLRWLQGDQDFLLLGLTSEEAHIYLGSLYSFKLLDSIYYDDLINVKKLVKNNKGPKGTIKNQIKKEDLFFSIREWIIEATKFSKPKLFIAGDESNILHLKRILKYKNLVREPISTSVFDPQQVKELSEKARRIVKNETYKNFAKALLEFRFADDESRVSKNIFQIAKAVVKGRVRKLIVTDELSIFGKIDLQSGGLAIHPVDMDHEDDCILDDLAQMVLNQGGEVIIAKRDEIPKGRPILAILDDEEDLLVHAKEPRAEFSREGFK